MSARVRTATALAALALAGSAAAGCSQAPEAPRAAPAAGSATESSEAAPLTGDVRACLGVEAVLGHVAADTARWSPQHRPYDKAVASGLRASSDLLARQGSQAQSPPVRRVVSGIAGSFRALSRAMVGRDRRAVTRAMTQAKADYRAYKSTCALD